MKDIDILNHLLGDSAITSIIGDNAWTTWLPEKANLPAITFNYVTNTPFVTLDSDTQHELQTITINIWTHDKQTADNLVDVVVARMSGFATRQHMAELNDEEQNIYRYAIDYSIYQ